MESEKMLEFVGIKKIVRQFAKAINKQAWEYPDGEWDLEEFLPNFPYDETACLKWFGVKLEKMGLEYLLFSDCGMHFCHITKPDPETENHMLVSTGGYDRAGKAFCRAIEELKDGGKK